MTSKVVKDLLTSNKLVVFSKSFCPHSLRLKSLLKNVGVFEKAKVLELDLLENGNELENEMIKVAGQHNVPLLFVDGELIGSAGDAHELHYEGKLAPKLNLALNIHSI